ncbi:MAG TPA: hypothetical protein VMQ81_07295 [Acidimicrobiia bacterium]|nr:hypothetical protein [Acidimicrobiia bacterium]
MQKPVTPAHVLGQVLLAGAAVVAYFGSGADDENSGIIEDGLGGAGDAFVIGLLWIVIPAVVVGVLDGLLSGRSAVPARTFRALVVIVLVLWAGLWVITATVMECDGTCIDVPTGTLFAALVAAEIGVVGSWLLGLGIAGLRNRGSAGVEAATPGAPDRAG